MPAQNLRNSAAAEFRETSPRNSLDILSAGRRESPQSSVLEMPGRSFASPTTDANWKTWASRSIRDKGVDFDGPEEAAIRWPVMFCDPKPSEPLWPSRLQSRSFAESTDVRRFQERTTRRSSLHLAVEFVDQRACARGLWCGASACVRCSRPRRGRLGVEQPGSAIPATDLRQARADRKGGTTSVSSSIHHAS